MRPAARHASTARKPESARQPGSARHAGPARRPARSTLRVALGTTGAIGALTVAVIGSGPASALIGASGTDIHTRLLTSAAAGAAHGVTGATGGTTPADGSGPTTSGTAAKSPAATGAATPAPASAGPTSGTATPQVAAAAVSPPGLAAGTPGTRLSGVNGSSVQSAADFGTWRGAPVTVVNNFMPKQTWAAMAHPTYGGPSVWAGQKVLTVWSVPMFPQTGGSLVSGAAGAYNGYFVSMARSLVANGQGHADIRLGWEMNGDWFTWSGIHNPTAYIAYWRQIVTAMRSVPGQSFTYDWAPANNQYFDSALLYPGDTYVDEVGQSVYDRSTRIPASDVAARWSLKYNGAYGSEGLLWLARFAALHHKPMAFAEWGLAKECSGVGGNDDAYFIQRMHDFFASHNVRYETYFNVDPSSCELHALNDGAFPHSAALYRQLWSADAHGRLSTAGVNYSLSSSRGASVKLNGATLRASLAYPWVAGAPSGTQRVTYYLDTPTTGAATHVEYYAPWDFAGGARGSANPLHVDRLSTGTHVLTAVLTGTYGTQQTVATFTVR